jgi:hypothetical protein
MGIRESRFNGVFRRELTKWGFKFDRIESHATAPGLPDNTFVHKDTYLSGWIEVKEEMIIPVRVKYRPKQAFWMQRHVRANGNAMTIIHIKKLKAIVLVPGRYSFNAEKDLRSLVLTEQALLLKISDGWDAIAAAIINQCKHTRRS